jgi:hypothetical protein
MVLSGLVLVLLGTLAACGRTTLPASGQTSTMTPTPSLTPSLTLSPTPIPATVQVKGTWKVVASPDTNTQQGELKGIAAASPSDLWAVGDTQASNGPTSLIEHGDGTRWTIVPSPSIGDGKASTLSAVAIVSSSDVWAVGAVGTTSERTLAEHWNGAEWSVVAIPNQGSQGSALLGIAAIDSSNVWAVGYYITGLSCGFQTQPLVEHWNGSQWSIVPSPHITGEGQLNAISATSASDIWAVGTTFNTESAGLIEHYAGASWSLTPALSGTYLLGVIGLSTNNAWAVGMSGGGPVIARWNGSHWTTVASPQVAEDQAMLAGISGVAANDLWAVGGNIPEGCSGSSHPLLEHWNGTAWTTFTSAEIVNVGYGYLDAVVAISSSDVWAVGAAQGLSGNGHSLILHYTA